MEQRGAGDGGRKSGDPALRPGSLLLDKYLIDREIGEGGMGRVYRARDRILMRDVAIKVLSAWQDSDSAFVRFQNEARTLSRLSHPNIAKVYDFGVSPAGEPFMVIELVEGMTLAELLDSEPDLPLADCLELLAQVAEALASAHRSGVIHRDVKPTNVLIKEAEDGSISARVIDFGIAKRSAGEQSLTRAGAVLGSPFYMSPEQAGAKEVTASSDIYSFGCVLFRAVAGRPPFSGATAVETLSMHLNSPPPSLRESVDFELPDELCDLVARLLAKDPRDRPESFDEVVAILRELTVEDDSGPADEKPGMVTAIFQLPAEKRRSFLIPVLVTTVICIAFVLIPIAQTIFYKPPPSPVSQTRMPGGDCLAVIEDLSDLSFEAVREGANTLDLEDSARQITDKQMEKAPASTSVIKVRLIDKIYITDRSVKALSRYPGTEELYLRGSKKIHALTGIENLPLIRLLDLGSLELAPEAFERIKSLKNLEDIRLSRTNITAAQVEDLLRAIPTLCRLELYDCPNIKLDDIARLGVAFPKVACEPDSFNDLTARFNQYIDDGQYEKALVTARKNNALLIRQKHPVPFKLGISFEQIGRAEQGLGHSKKAEEAYRQGFSIARQAEEHELMASASSRLYWLFRPAGRIDEAELAALEGVKAMEPLGDRSLPERIQWYRVLACHARERGDKAKAQRFFADAISLGGKLLPIEDALSATGAARVADCYRYLDRLTEAELWVGRALAILARVDPKEPEARNNACEAYVIACHLRLLKGDLEGALALNDACLELVRRSSAAYPGMSVLLGQRLNILNGLGREKEARAIQAEIESLAGGNKKIPRGR
ncbi:MAG: protein kinase [Candidatus Melainabacteria bacterium]|nr:protein kinase [Candidatus Melainabacteria bacterium]